MGWTDRKGYIFRKDDIIVEFKNEPQMCRSRFSIFKSKYGSKENRRFFQISEQQ